MLYSRFAMEEQNVTVKKLGKALWIVTILQLVLGIGIFMWQTDSMFRFLIGVMLFSCLLTMAGVFFIYHYQNENYRESLENLEKLNSRLREQRHDYLNQFQIIYGLLELEEYEEARDYLRPVFKDMMKVSKALKTAHPAVNALLQAKMEHAEKQGIDFYLEVGTTLPELSMEAWELCKVLGNLIDNAVTALNEVEGERSLSLEIRENREEYLFSIRNNGPKIPEQNQKMIFYQGFTTKKEEGHGMGLAIVASVLKEAGGSISFTSDEKETAFFVEIPKRNDSLKRKMYK